MQEGVVFSVCKPELVFGCILSTALGLVGDTAALYGNLALLDSSVELCVRRWLLLIYQSIDRMQPDTLAKFLIVSILHCVKTLLECLIAIEIDVVLGRHRLHSAIQLGVALACTQAYNEQHSEARGGDEME